MIIKRLNINLILKRKRNWKSVKLKKSSSGYIIFLDDNILKTPAGTKCLLKSRDIAHEVCKEWSRIKSEINYNYMPYTKMSFLSVDRSERESMELKTKLVAYGMSDLLCYRAEIESDLAKLQSKGWDPLLKWAQTKLNLTFMICNSIMPVEQSRGLELKLLKLVKSIDSLELTTFNELVTLSGSLIISFAIQKKKLSPEKAWKLTRIDEDWQRHRWGKLEEHRAEDKIKRSLFMQACKILQTIEKG